MDEQQQAEQQAEERQSWWLRAWMGVVKVVTAPVRLWLRLFQKGEGLSWRVPVGLLIGLLALELIAAPFIMFWNHRFAGLAPIPQRTEEHVPGVAYVDALLRIHGDAMRPWLPNDRVYPTIFLDNPQNFQLGVLEAMRYGVRTLRDDLSRQRTSDALDPDVEEAHTALNISAHSWMFPQAEAEYARAVEALKRYRERLIAGEAHFHPRADNLVKLLSQFNSLTGGANTRLYNCVGDLRLRRSEENADDPFSRGESIVKVDVKWSEVDDHFFYARGVALVYRELMAAVEADFHQVLEVRNADELAHSIVVDFLNHAQFTPLYVANGRYGSLWANHPYQLLGLLSQVREKSRSLISMLSVPVH